MKNYVDVVIFRNVLSLDRLYTYVADFETEVGDFILVDFNGDLLIALVLKKYSDKEKIGIKNAFFKVKEIQPLNQLFIDLGLWMKSFYILTYGKAFGIICDFSSIYNIKYQLNDSGEYVPSYKISTYEKETYYSLNFGDSECTDLLPKNATAQINFLEELREFFKEYNIISMTELRELKFYVKKNFDIFLSKKILIKVENNTIENKIEKIALNDNQKQIFEEIKNSSENKFLIRGVTGSGKTEIYFSLIEEGMKRGKTSLLLVPEIGLTPQMVNRAKTRFGENVSLIHSKLTNKERLKELEKIESGVPQVVLGTRSAIFSKIKNLSYIIIDEEHDDSYKLDSHNKYDVREVARYIIENTKDSKLIIASATPSIESYYKAKNDVYKLFLLNERANMMPLPKVTVVDMREELKMGNTTIFSMDLMAGMKSALNRHEQILLFLNRRGYSPAISCRDCGHTIMCESCDIPMVYHKNINMLKCHYCGKIKSFKRICPNCGSKKIKQFGIGTEKLEESTRELFQDFEILRIDSDTTNKKKNYELNYDRIKNKEVSIIIGTQMITKGMDMPNITLVGVVAADISLNIPEYDATEKTFQLITQVAGRAGRSNKPGEVIVQTYNPDHYSISLAKNHDYEAFYETELKFRNMFSYPPFKRLITIVLLSSYSDKLMNIYEKVIKILKEEIKNLNLSDEISVTSAERNPMLIKINNRYQTKIMINTSVKNEKFLKSLIYDVLIRNTHKIDLGYLSFDLLIR